MGKLGKRILVASILLLIIIQFIRIDKTNPVSDPKYDLIEILQPPADLAQIIKVSCYDCHSHHTEYPWYTNFAPFSFWIKGHINEARRHLNFSEWGTYNNKRASHKLEECYEQVLNGHMPLPSYLWMHSEAKITEDQRKSLSTWFQNQIPKYPSQD